MQLIIFGVLLTLPRIAMNTVTFMQIVPLDCEVRPQKNNYSHKWGREGAGEGNQTIMFNTGTG